MMLLPFLGMLLALSGADGLLSDAQLVSEISVADAHYEQARSRCEPLLANQYDICQELAYGEYNIALAALKYRHSGRAEDEAAVVRAREEAEAAVAAERCEDLPANAQIACHGAALAERSDEPTDRPVSLD